MGGRFPAASVIDVGPGTAWETQWRITAAGCTRNATATRRLPAKPCAGVRCSTVLRGRPPEHIREEPGWHQTDHALPGEVRRVGRRPRFQKPFDAVRDRSFSTVDRNNGADEIHRDIVEPTDRRKNALNGAGRRGFAGFCA